jgi:flavin-dependent dehydrogenase
MVMIIQSKFDTDIVIVGGGPAGLAAAIAARRKGFRVSVVDSAHPPIDKACGEGLMPDGVAALNRLGVELPADRAIPFRGIRFVEGGNSVGALFLQGLGMGMRRTTLHETLANQAAQAGANILWGAQVNGVNSKGVVINGNTLQTRWIIGADGEDSRVRKWAGLNRSRTERTRFGFRRHFGVAPWTDLVEVHWGRGCQIVITPVSPEEICAGLLSWDSRLRIEDALPLFPELLTRLGNAVRTSKERGALSSLRALRAVTGGRFALLGDASGSVDAITGEGLCLAFQQALSLADALEQNDLELYEAAHRNLAQPPILMSKLMLAMGRHQGLRERVMKKFIKSPEIFSHLLKAHVAAGPGVRVGMGGVLKLGWQVVTG